MVTLFSSNRLVSALGIAVTSCGDMEHEELDIKIITNVPFGAERVNELTSPHVGRVAVGGDGVTTVVTLNRAMNGLPPTYRNRCSVSRKWNRYVAAPVIFFTRSGACVITFDSCEHVDPMYPVAHWLHDPPVQWPSTGSAWHWHAPVLTSHGLPLQMHVCSHVVPYRPTTQISQFDPLRPLPHKHIPLGGSQYRYGFCARHAVVEQEHATPAQSPVQLHALVACKQFPWPLHSRPFACGHGMLHAKPAHPVLHLHVYPVVAPFTHTVPHVLPKKPDTHSWHSKPLYCGSHVQDRDGSLHIPCPLQLQYTAHPLLGHT